MKKIVYYFSFTLLFVICFNTGRATTIFNPVLPGDRPDPTIIKIGDTYWASATSNEWSPLFPIFKSKDMINWELVSYIFPKGAPGWALNNFWAPELSYDEKQKKVFVYYTARSKKNNRLTIAVASADSPDGNYTDHGPLVSQKAGSIDAFEITDDNGKIYMAWKEDGNSIGRPTPIWMQEINPDRTKLIGQPIELFRNNESDDTSWERWLVEGVCIFKKGKYYYATYSGGSCCDKKCNYKTGVARSESISGPWKKYENNPILTDNTDWKCSGHGTMVKNGNDYYMLYHAYNTIGDVYVGRQGVLEKIEWTDDEWPIFRNKATYDRVSESLNFTDNFTEKSLKPVWQWRVTQNIDLKTGNKGLYLGASSENEQIGTLLVQQSKSLNYTLKADIDLTQSGNNTFSGVSLVGGIHNGFGAPLAAIGIYVGKNRIEIRKNQQTLEILDKADIKANKVTIIMHVTQGYLLSFSYEYNRKNIAFDKQIDASGLVPWGMGFRFGIVASGTPGEYACFKKVELINN